MKEETTGLIIWLFCLEEAMGGICGYLAVSLITCVVSPTHLISEPRHENNGPPILSLGPEIELC